MKSVVVVAARVAVEKAVAVVVEKAVAVAMSVAVENPEEVVGKGTHAEDFQMEADQTTLQWSNKQLNYSYHISMQ